MPRCACVSRSLFHTALFFAATLFGFSALSAYAAAQTAQFSFAQNTIASFSSSPSYPTDVAVDTSGNVYVADAQNNWVVKETPSASGYTQSVVASGLGSPNGVAVDNSGNVYIADTTNNRILKETPSGSSYTQSVAVSGLNFPNSVTVDGSGNLYIADSGNNRVVKETLSGTTYSQSIVASGLSNPSNVAVDGSGNVYISDSGNNRVVKETLSGGSYTQSVVATSGLNGPTGIAVDSRGDIYIVDSQNNRILKEALSNGSYTQSVIGIGLSFPDGLALDNSGDLYVADSYNARVVEIQANSVNFESEPVGSTSAALTLTFTFDSAGTIGAPVALTQGAANLDFADAATGTCNTNGTSHSYAAGDTCTVDVTFSPKYAGMRDGAVELTNSSGAVLATAYVYGTGTGPQAAFAPAAQSVIASNLTGLNAVATDGIGNLYVSLYSDTGGTTVSKAVKETLSGGSYSQSALGSGLYAPVGIAVDGAGNVYIADSGNNRVVVETPVGGNYSQSSIGSGLNDPEGVAVDGAGNVYIADTANNRVLKETRSGSGYVQSQILSLNYPATIAVDGSGNLYVLAIGSNSESIVVKETLSGGSYSQSTITSGLSDPYGIAVDGAGDIYIAESGSNRVVIETPVSGGYSQSTIGSGLNQPTGVAVDGAGNLYIDDYVNNRVVKEDMTAPPSLSFTQTVVGSTSSDSPQTVTVRNIGNATLTFPAPSSGNNPSIAANFSVDSQTSCPNLDTSSSAGTLASGTTCAIGVDFTPTAAGSITGSLVLTDNNLNAAAPGYATQTIALSGTGASFAIVPAAGALTSATLGVPYSETFSTNNSTGTFTFSAGSGLPSGLTLSSAGVLSGTPTEAGSYSFAVTATGSGGLTTNQSYTLQVQKATPVVSGTTPSVSVGTAGTSTVTVTGVAGVMPTGTVAYSIDSGASQSVTLSNGSATIAIPGTLASGAHTIALTYNGDTNYNSASGAVSFSIGTATPLISWAAPLAITYGTALSATQLDATAAYNGTVVAGTFTYNPAAGTVLAAGTHTLSASFAPSDTTTYATPAATTVGITVNPAPLTVTATSTERVYGAANPTFTGAITGAKNNDKLTETFSTSATQTSNVGQYSIVPSVTGADLANYTVTATNGTLTIKQASTATALSASSASLTPGQNLTITAQVTDASTGSTGTPTGTVSFYNGTTLLGTGTLVGGAASYTTSSSFSAGTTLSLTATYSGDTNFTGSTSSSAVSVPVASADFSFTGTGQSAQTVKAGSSVSFTFQTSPIGQSYPGAVSFSTLGLPTGATVTFSPATVAANGGTQAVTMTIQTSTNEAMTKSGNPFDSGAPLMLALLLFPLFGSKRARKSWLGRGAVLVLLVVAGVGTAISLSACFVNPGIPEQSIPITVTATSGSVQHSVGVTMNVTQQ